MAPKNANTQAFQLYRSMPYFTIKLILEPNSDLWHWQHRNHHTNKRWKILVINIALQKNLYVYIYFSFVYNEIWLV